MPGAWVLSIGHGACVPPRRLSSHAPADRHGIVTHADALRDGVDLDVLYRDLRSGRLERAHRGVYRLPDAEDPHAAARAAVRHLGASAVVVIDSAAGLHQLEGARNRPTVAAAVPRGSERRQRAGIALHFWDMPASDVVEVDGIAVTSVVRTLADCARLLPRFEAVALVDSALHRGLVVPEQFDQIGAIMGRRPGCPAGRQVLRDARVGAQSPLETRVRLRASDGGFPPDRLQVPVHEAQGRLIGIVDLGYRLPNGGWLYVEADGRSVHELPDAVLHDRHRQNAIVNQSGSHLLRVTWDDTMDARTIPDLLRPILRRHGWRPASRGC